MSSITYSTYLVLINGSPVGKIYPSRGIRQDDPISPYIYLICTEGFSKLIQKQNQAQLLHGFKASRAGP